MNPLRLSILLCLVSLVAGCGVSNSTSASDSGAEPGDVVLLSVNPQKAKAGDKGAIFHGYPVLGEVTLTGEDRKVVLAALAKGIAEAPELGARCFIPRHGLRVTENGATVEHLICFECSWIYTYEGGKRTVKCIANTPRGTFNRVLRDADIPLAK